MENLFMLLMMFCVMLICVSCKKCIKFDVFEENPSLIDLADESNINEIKSDDELKIYKNYNQMVNDFTSKGFIIKDDRFLEKYCDDFFDVKSLVLFYSIDSREGFKYTFQSISITDNELILNIKINKNGESVTMETPRLFIIEINKNDVNSFDKLKCKIK